MTQSDGQQLGRVEPSSEAERLAEEMAGATELHEEVLREAAETGNESGRSVCGTAENAKEPSDRSFSNVVLKGCPLNNRGFIHGGGGHDPESPEHSLIDMANVIFGYGDASLVVGAREGDMMLAPSDEYETDVVAEFRNAIGAEVEGTSDVEAALSSGKIRDPSSARRRFRRSVPSLFRTVDTGVSVGGSMASTAAGASITSVALSASKTPRDRAIVVGEDVLEWLASIFTFDLSDLEFNLADMVVSQFIDALLLAGFLSLLGGTPRQLVR